MSMDEAFIPDRRTDRDRRRAPRTPASGPVEVIFQAPMAVKVSADLIESRATGFRIAHNVRDLVAGTEVSYRHAAGSGRARVVWTHVLEDRCVSGLLQL